MRRGSSRACCWRRSSRPTHEPLAEVAPGLVRRAPAVESDLSRLTDSFHLNLTAFGFLAFAVGLFIVHSAIGLAFEQRRPIFRTLRAVGLPLRTLVLLMVAELLVLSAVAGLIGVALGYGVASLLLPDVAASLRGLYGAEVPGTLSIRPSVWGLGLAIAVAGTLVSAASRLWRIAAMPLLAPARPRAWSLASERSLRLQAAGGLAAARRGVADRAFGTGLVAGFAALGAMLLGAALILPLLLSLLLKLGERLSRGVVRAVVLGRHAPAAAGPVAGADGAAAGARRQCRRGHHGAELPPHLRRLARPAAAVRTLCHHALRRRSRSRCMTGSATRSDAVLPIWNTEVRHVRPAGAGLRHRRPRHLPRPLAAARSHARRLGQDRPRRRRARQRAAGAAAEAEARRPDPARGRAAACRWSASSPTMAIPRAQ